MRIGHIAPGIRESVHLELSKALRRAGHEVFVLTDDPAAASVRRFSVTHEDGVQIYAIHSSRRNPWVWLPDRALKALLGKRFFTMVLTLAQFIRQTRCDVYIVEGDALGPQLALLQRFLRFRWVISVHDHESLGVKFGYAGEPAGALREAAKKWVLRSASGVRANSDATQDVLARAGIRAETVPLHWTPRMRVEGDVQRFRTRSRDEIRTRHGLPSDARILVASCRLTPTKGLELAVQALAERKTRPDTWLLICGADRRVEGLGSYQAYLGRAAGDAGVRERVVFVGEVPLEAIKPYYAAADVHVAPSYFDTFSYSALEAALTGTPSALTDRVGCAPWLANCGAAAVVVRRDAATFAEAISRAAAKRDAAAVTAMIECVAATLSPDAIARQLAAVVARVVH